MKKLITILLSGLILLKTDAQVNNSLFAGRDTVTDVSRNFMQDALPKITERRQFIKSLAVPALFITYGIVSLNDEELRDFDEGVKGEVWSEHQHQPKHIDNFLVFVPAVSVYGLNLAGIHGQHDFRDRSMLFLLSNLINNAIVYSVKPVVHRLRPDGSSYSSFPSGHTAEAFTSAEFLYQEYKTVSPWYGIAGYATAATVGYLRMYNNKHWFSDIVTGAGIGIFSTKLAYRIYPAIRRILFRDKPSQTAILPVYQNKSFGFSMIRSL